MTQQKFPFNAIENKNTHVNQEASLWAAFYHRERKANHSYQRTILRAINGEQSGLREWIPFVSFAKLRSILNLQIRIFNYVNIDTQSLTLVIYFSERW